MFKILTLRKCLQYVIPYTVFTQRHIMKNLFILISKYFYYIAHKYADTLILLSGLQSQTIKKTEMCCMYRKVPK